MSGDLWAVVLAAGEGSRLAGLTEKLYGSPLPKQFAVLAGRTSLLQDTVERIVPLVPPERIVVVVPDAFEALASAQLARWEGVHLVPQPKNRGTGPGILLPLAHVLAEDPDATVCICPSDHAFGDAGALRRALRRAVKASRAFPMVAVGVRATRPETEYGWLRLAPGEGHVHTVRRFVEKPDPGTAERLLAEGALWNTFLTVGRACDIWAASAHRMPEHAEALLDCVPVTSWHGRREVAEVYAHFTDRNFSKEVLEREERLGAVELVDPAWSDLGSPDRVYAALRRSGELDVLHARMGFAS